MRRRVNISITEDMYGELSAMTEKYGFKSICELTVSCLRLMLYRKHLHAEIPSLDVDAHTEIDEMFAELSDSTPTPYNTAVPKIHRTRR